MAHYGGMGGVRGGRTLNEADKFEMAVHEQMGERLRKDRTLCVELWSALANMDWLHKDGDTASYSFRAAGDLVAAVVGEGDYMDFYCGGPSGVVSDRIRTALARAGWHPYDGEED